MNHIHSTSVRALRARTLLFGAAMLCAAPSLFAESYFGFAPLDPLPESTSAQGSGKNGYAEAAITIDPATNPAAAALNGKKILGVRCFMRADYPQKNKRTSAINIRTGSLSAEPVKNYVNFFEGWNDIMLDEPVTIGEEPIYIGPMVYETSGTPYPFVSAAGGAMPGGYNISLNKGDWQQLSQRGNLLMHLIIDAEPEELPFAAQAAPCGLPSVAAPESSFSCEVSVHNFSSQPIESAEITTTADYGGYSSSSTVYFDPPLPPYDSRTVETTIPTGKMEDPAVEYSLAVTSLNALATEMRPSTPFTLHVTSNAYVRIPLIEEFTSMNCVNCPFMAYYLDIAMEEWDKPLVYITRHTGFANDLFTLPFEQELLYLFGTNGTYNPAIMYDRTLRSESDYSPVYMADPNPSPLAYLEAIEEAASRPAFAKIIVDSENAGGKVNCVAHGKIADGIPLDGLYLSAALIENGIPADPPYLQSGVHDAPDDAPEDLAERFRHNGIVRVQFNKEGLGDALTVDPDTREFRVDFGTFDTKPEWKAENCETVAFICRINKEDLSDNYVLNAGGTRWNKFVGDSGVETPVSDRKEVKVNIGPDRRIIVEGDHTSVDVWSLSGHKISADSPLPAGIHIVCVILSDGTRRTFKIATT